MCWCLSHNSPKLQNKSGLILHTILGCSGSTKAHLSLPVRKVLNYLLQIFCRSPSISWCLAAISIVIEGCVERRNFLTLNNTRVSARQCCFLSPSRWTEAKRESKVSSSSDISRDKNFPSLIYIKATNFGLIFRKLRRFLAGQFL